MKFHVNSLTSDVKHCPGFFLCIFSSLTCLKKPGFSKVGSSDQRNVPASLSLFLKSEKILALLYVANGPGIGPSVIFDLFRPREQISNRGRACTQALLLYIKIRSCRSPTTGIVFDLSELPSFSEHALTILLSKFLQCRVPSMYTCANLVHICMNV